MAPNTLLAIIAPFAVLELILLAVALVDLVRREPDRVKGPKWVWALVILFFQVLGPVAYFVAGRKD